jgi:hypothetical protein
MLIVRRYNGVMVLEVAWGREDAGLARADCGVAASLSVLALAEDGVLLA